MSKRLQNLSPSPVVSPNVKQKGVKKKSKKKKQKTPPTQRKKKQKKTPRATKKKMFAQTCTPMAQATLITSSPAPVFHIPVTMQTVPVANAFYSHSPKPQTSHASTTLPLPSNPHIVAFFEELRLLQERIALNPDNTCGLDNSLCTNKRCPYSTGTLSLQRYNLLVRAFQINHMWSRNPHLQKIRDHERYYRPHP